MDKLLNNAKASEPAQMIKYCELTCEKIYSVYREQVGRTLELTDITVDSLAENLKAGNIPVDCCVKATLENGMCCTLAVNTTRTGFVTIKGAERILEESIKTEVNLTHFYFKRLLEGRTTGPIADIFEEAVLSRRNLGDIHGVSVPEVPDVEDTMKQIMGNPYKVYKDKLEGFIKDFNVANLDIQLHYLESIDAYRTAYDILEWLAKLYDCVCLSAQDKVYRSFNTQYNMDGSVSILANGEGGLPIIVLRGDVKRFFAIAEEWME